MAQIKECIEKAGSYLTNITLDATGLGVIVDDFRHNPGRLRELRRETEDRKGLQKLAPYVNYASEKLFFSVMEFSSPSFVRGLSAAITPEYKNYNRGSAVGVCGIIPDMWVFISSGADFLDGRPEALGLKLLYNAGARVVLDVLRIPRLCDSLRERSVASKHVPT